MVHGKKNPHNRTIPQPPHEGALSLFSLLFFIRFFRKLGSISKLYEPVSIFTSTIYVLSSRARIMREKQPLTTRNLMFKDEKFNVILSLKYEKFNVLHEKPLH